jgi:hypothetical protein
MSSSIADTRSELGAVPSEMQWVLLDVGSEQSIAKIRLPIPVSEGGLPELDWCRRQLDVLLLQLKSGTPTAPVEIDFEDGASRRDVIHELEKALSIPNGISSTFRGRWAA